MTLAASEVDVSARFVDEYKTAMRHVVSPVAVVTYAGRAGRSGFTCTAICSASTLPPCLIVCVNNAIPECAEVIEAGMFAVNFLTDEQSEIARQFSQSAEVEARFSVGGWSEKATGAPILDATNASFECRIETVIEHGSHSVLIGAVVGLDTSEGAGLLYRDGFFRRLATE